MTGYITGTLADPDGAEELLRTAAQSLKVAEQLNCPRLNVHGTGLDDKGLPVIGTDVVSPEMWLTAARTLSRLAELGEQAGRVFTLENLNTAVDHPRTPFAKAADTLALVEAVDNPYLRMNLDLYHAQIGEGNLIQLVERALPVVGEIQVADVPGRCEPGTGEINYPAVAAALNGWVTTASSPSRPSPPVIRWQRSTASDPPSRTRFDAGLQHGFASRHRSRKGRPNEHRSHRPHRRRPDLLGSL